jgi:phosphate-selective porin OprO/OprP
MAFFLSHLGRWVGVCVAAALVGGTAASQGPEPPSFPEPPAVLPVTATEPAAPPAVPGPPAAVPLKAAAEPLFPPARSVYAADGLLPAVKPAAPKYPTARLTGVFQLDSLYTSQDSRNLATVGNVRDGLDFRRVRLAGVGNLAEDISYRLELDFAASQARFVDVWATFAKVPVVGNVRVGRYRQPFGMDAVTSASEQPFLERPLTFALLPGRQTGVMVFDAVADDRVTYALSGYRYNSDPFGNVATDAAGYGLAARLTGLPYYQDDSHLIHLGADYMYNRPGGTNPIRFQSAPEVFVGSTSGSVLIPTIAGIPPYVDSGLLAVEAVSVFNLEAAAVSGNVAVQSEARAAVVREANGNTATLPAYYAEARYVLTGEDIPYSKTGGVFRRVRPRNDVSHGGPGAWEVAARWSYVDLNGTTPAPGTPAGPGRRLNDLTLGLNWYLVDNAKFQFNYIHPILNDARLGTSNADFFALRCQVDF